MNQLNAHPRDTNLKFDPKEHVYTFPSVPLQSVTSWVADRFAKFNGEKAVKSMQNGKKWNEKNKYWGMTSNEIRAKWADDGEIARDLGTQLHADIEKFYEFHPEEFQKVPSHRDLIKRHFEYLSECTPEERKAELDRLEWRYFLEFVCDTPNLVPFRSEWRIYHEQFGLAGSIDMVYRDITDNSYIIVDWKRSNKPIETVCPYQRVSITPELSFIPDTKYWHYVFQLNLYKIILETKYSLPIKKLRVIRLHPEHETYHLLELPEIDSILKVVLSK